MYKGSCGVALLIAAVLGLVLPLSAVGQPVEGQLRGSGSTFAYPALAQWATGYEKAGGTHVEFQPIGSTAGMSELRAGVVDFSVSDVPLDNHQLLRDGLAQFPVVIGAIVPVVNLDGIAVGQLRLTGQLLAGIYLGRITNWSDAAIAAVNPGLSLPSQAIRVVHRSDGSGTTFNWTDYLSKVSEEWRLKVGAGPLVGWPTGAGAKGSDGVAEYLAHSRGTIGYVEYGLAVRKKLSYAFVANRAGNFVAPGPASFRAAIAGTEWLHGQEFYVSLTNAAHPDAYPIMAASFALIPRYPRETEAMSAGGPIPLAVRSRDVLAFFRFALHDGRETAASLNYLPLPPSLVQEVGAYWNSNWGVNGD
jgi:phosphate transport system substrate-binding protein